MNPLFSLNPTPSIPLTLYIHIPWCIQKCPYCDFNSYTLKTPLPEAVYIQTLARDLTQDLPFIQGRTIKTIFFGGGTPSLFSPQSIEKIINQVAAIASLEPKLEITLEANPGAIEHKNFKDYQKAGITRISLGAQSFQEDKLKSLGRIHTALEIKKAITAIIAARFDSFNLDLMYGLPKQTLEDALFDLKTALSFSPPHLSWYNLTIEPNTIFHHQKPPLPLEETIAAIEQAGKALLQNDHLNQYEISAFAIANHQSQHNLNYWQFGDYLGIGAGAHGKITDLYNKTITRYAKTRHPKNYLSPHHLLFAEKKIIPPADLPLEFMLNALRLSQGITVQQFEAHTGLPITTVLPTLQVAHNQKLLQLSKDKIIPTALGKQYLNNLLALFF